MRATLWVEATLTGAVLLLVAGCVLTAPIGNSSPSTSDGHSGSGSGDGFGGIDNFEADYRMGVDQLAGSLPPGVEFPARVPGSWEDDAAFELGAGAMQAALYWQCSWLNAYVSAKEADDVAARDEAIDRLDAWITLPAVEPNVDDRSRDLWVSEYVEPARVGRDDNLMSLLPC
jgi:hypothetical protein